jgi:hypothetical protein
MCAGIVPSFAPVLVLVAAGRSNVRARSSAPKADEIGRGRGSYPMHDHQIKRPIARDAPMTGR